ncbi:hypothetical protein GTU79_28380 [Sodalis ligni]|nr:hypothetical protein [Sodalis ligni]QWA11004.1 hypothetical protein GTU79_28380 [Sodalis ligni]
MLPISVSAKNHFPSLSPLLSPMTANASVQEANFLILMANPGSRPSKA